jgi:LPXTG-motif cell wall-anchored protein
VSTNRRTAIAVRSIGVASAAAALALGVAGNALACSPSDFAPTVSCASGKADIKITDHDGTGTPVTITVFNGDQQVGTGSFDHPRKGDSIDILVPWSPSTTYRIHVKTPEGAGYPVDGDIPGGVTTSADACSTPVPPSTPASPSTSPSTPTATASATPSGTPSSTTSAPAVAATSNAPSPAAGGSQNLAETGGGSNTGLIAGVAAALVAVGGGAIFALRRRNPAARH